jgi:putative ABC transport system permease protein
MLRHKGFSFINIAGLTLGLTACLLIGLFLRDEKQYDHFAPAGERIYRVYYDISAPEGNSRIATTPPVFRDVLQHSFPEVEKTLRMMSHTSKELFEIGDRKFYEDAGLFVDSTFFEFFPLQFKYGSSNKVLSDPASLVISENMAKKYFGDTDPVGKTLMFDKEPFQVTAVFHPNPKFHLQPSYIASMKATGLTGEQLESWATYAYHNYVLLKEGTDVKGLESRFQKYAAPFTKDPQKTFLPKFQALHDIHLYAADFQYDVAVRGNITYVNALTIISIFILLIACFNFVNLATARSLQRAKEVGIRKTIGADRKQLLVHFIGETVLLTFICILLAVLLTMLLLPYLNNFTGKQIQFAPFTDPVILPVLLAMTVIVGILAGFYPALVMSGFKPVKVLKGIVTEDNPGRVPWLRYGLVVIQFSLSVLLIISALVVIRQVNFLHSKALGFNKEQILFFPMRGDKMQQNYEAFKTDLLQVPGISSVTIGYGFPGDMFGDGMMKIPKDGSEKRATQLMVDHDYIKTLGLNLVAGRDFSKDIKTDQQQAYIINETAVKELGFGSPEKALGQTLLWNTWRNPDLVKRGQVVGVVKDFHYKSLYEKVEPAVLQIYPEAYWKVAVKMKTTEINNTISSIKNVWNNFTPDYPIEYNFLDESFNRMYQSEDKLKSLLWIFTVITIFVACLGLFGLAAYTAERRRKEIGIRKVLGATVPGVVILLSKDFIKLVILSLIIASPVAWYFMNDWLQDFSYRVSISWWIFAGAGIIAIAIALLTVSFQAVKAALMNPVRNLRTE